MDEPRTTTSPRLAYVHRRVARLLAAIGGLIAGVPLLGVVAAAALADRALTQVIGSLLPATTALGALGALVAFVLGEAPFARAGTLSRDLASGALMVERASSRRSLPEAKSGCLVPAGTRFRAEIDLENGDQLHVDAADLPAAIEVLQVAGVDAAKQRARFRVDSALARAFGAMSLMSVLALFTLPVGIALIRGSLMPRAVGAALWIAALGALTKLAMSFVGMPEITVGTDGIAYQRGPFRRFIPLSEIKEVRSSDITLYVHIKNGRVIKLRSLTGADPGRAYSLELRVREALAAARGEHTSAQLELLERKGRSVADWTSSVAGLARAGSSYRAASLSAEDLDAIVTSPDVTPERRIGAALALSNAGVPTAGERIRIAAAQCASPRLRIALERVGEGSVDLEAIGEALAETEAQQALHAERRR